MLRTESLEDKRLLILTPVYPNYDNSYIGGLFIKNQVAHLKERFNSIVIIAPVFRSVGLRNQDRQCTDYSYDNVKVYFPRCNYIPITWTHGIVADNRLKTIKSLIEKKDISFDLIHAHFTWPSGYIGTKIKEEYGKPLVLTVHENSEWFDKEMRMNNPSIVSAWQGADAIIRVNKKDVLELKKFNAHTYYVPNGFSKTFYPIDRTLARNQLGLPNDARIIFSLGNLIKRKGFNYLIDGMDQVFRHKSDVECYIGGSGPEGRRLKAQIDRLRIGDRVRLIGAIKEEKLNFWMNACDLFVSPSLSESFGIVQIEAMACGKPVISARNRGSEEVITSGEVGLLVEPENAADLADKILYALNRDWDQNAILAYAEQFTWENIVKDIIQIYELLV